jgi:hypothetical protein
LRKPEQVDWKHFSESTSYLIRRWMTQLGALAIHHEAVLAQLHWAWKLRHPPPGAESLYQDLVTVQDHRSSQWWRNLDKGKLTVESRHHHRGAQGQQWEDLLCSAFGLAWRDRCCAEDWKTWRRSSLEGLDKICREWSLPARPDPVQKSNKPNLLSKKLKAKRKTTKKPEAWIDPPKQATIPTKVEFEKYMATMVALRFTQTGGTKPRLSCTVDAQILAGWLNGVTECTFDPDSDHTLSQIMNMVYDISQFCIFDAQNDNLWLNWKRREFNIEADYITNLAMDLKQNIHWWNADALIFSTNYHYSIFSDGGLRINCGAAGWVIRRTCVKENIIIGMGADYVLDESTTVPQLEAKGLHDALKHFCSYCRHVQDVEENTINCVTLTDFLQAAGNIGSGRSYKQIPVNTLAV